MRNIKIDDGAVYYIKNHYESQHNGENIALGISDDNDDLSSTKATLILEQGDKDWLII